MEHNAQNIIEKVLILARSDFPGGIAQSRRILSLARAVKKNGKEALVVLLNSLGKIKLQQKDNPTPKKGVEKGIEYIYAYNNINGSGNIIKKISSLIFGSYQAIKIVRHEARNKKIGLLSYEDNPAYIFLIAVWSRYKKIPLYMDLVEDNTIKRDKFHLFHCLSKPCTCLHLVTFSAE